MWYLWFFILEAVVILTGNVTVLVMFTRTPALRKRKHFLLTSLAVADLLVGVISVPTYITLLLLRNTEIIWKIYSMQDILFATASVFGLAAVAIERAYAVYFPFKHRTLWKGVYMIGIAVIWIMAALISFCSIYFRGIFTYEIIILFFPIIFSLAVIAVTYSFIWIKMNCMTSVQGHAIQGRDNRLTVTLLIVKIISLIAWIPFQALMTYVKLCQHVYSCVVDQHVLVVITKFLHYGNSLVNPIIYALRMPQFKRAVFNAVRCCKQDQVSVQVPNERPEAIRANVIPLITNYNNKAFRIGDEQGSAMRDETQLNHNSCTAQVYGRDEIQTNDEKEDTTL